MLLIALVLPALAGSVDPAETPATLPAEVCVEDGTPAGILADGAVLLDERRVAEARAAAAGSLAARGDARALPLLRAGARDRDPAVQIASIDAAVSFRDAEASAIVVWVVHDGPTAESVRLHAIDALGRMQREDAGQALWSAAGDRALPGALRTASRRALEESYPELLARVGPPRVVSDPGGAALAIAGHGVLGGVLLSSVGTWGKFDAAPAIGGAGGALIGVSTGALYTIGHPVTLGDGLAYASGVGWGLAGGVMFTAAVIPPPARYETFAASERRADQAAVARSIGVMAGAGIAAWDLRNRPRAEDVAEVDVAGYLGSAMALGVSDLAAGEKPTWDSYDYPDEDEYLAFEESLRADGQRRAASSLGGSALGLTAGALLAKRWHLDPEDMVFASAVGAEAAWIGAWWPTAVGLDDSDLRGTLRVPLHGAVIGSLALAEARPISVQASALGAYGAVMGNALGAGAPLLAGERDGRPISQVMLPLGAAGLVAGVVAEPWLAPTAGDWTMIAVGTPIAAAEGEVVGEWLVAHGHMEERQAPGLALTAGGAVGTGLLVAGHWVDPKPADALFMGSVAVWGAWYGTMVPVAADTGGQPIDAAMAGAVTADVFLLGGAALIGPAGLDPRRSLLAQTAGLSGATLGALGTAMFSRDGHDVAWGALAGSTVGIVGGAAITALAPPKGGAGDFARLPRVRLPGVWLPTAAPLVDGQDVGLQLGVVGVGW